MSQEIAGNPDIPAPGEAGLRYVPPPAALIPDITGQIQSAIDAIGDADAALVAVADRKGGWNGALVIKGAHGWDVSTWLAKEWGSDSRLDYGVQVRKLWKF